MNKDAVVRVGQKWQFKGKFGLGPVRRVLEVTSTGVLLGDGGGREALKFFKDNFVLVEDVEDRVDALQEIADDIPGPESLHKTLTAAGFIVKDSGQRQSFASGMTRDTTEGKTDFSRVFDGPMIARWAEHLTKGAVKYPDVEPGVPNWTLAAGKEELIRFRKSAVRHFAQWLRGDVDEDHAAAVYFNICGYEHVKAKLEAK